MACILNGHRRSRLHRIAYNALPPPLGRLGVHGCTHTVVALCELATDSGLDPLYDCAKGATLVRRHPLAPAQSPACHKMKFWLSTNTPMRNCCPVVAMVLVMVPGFDMETGVNDLIPNPWQLAGRTPATGSRLSSCRAPNFVGGRRGMHSSQLARLGLQQVVDSVEPEPIDVVAYYATPSAAKRFP